MLDDAPPVVLASILSQGMLGAVAFRYLPGIENPVITIDAAESLKVSFVLTSPVLTGICQRNQFLALENKCVAIVVFREALIRLSFDRKKTEGPADAAKPVSR